MVWSCEACTFVNSSEHASRCEICATVRLDDHPSSTSTSSSSDRLQPSSGAIQALDIQPVKLIIKKSSTASNKKTTQTTLFGKKIAAGEDDDGDGGDGDDDAASSKVRKRKAASSALASSTSSSSSKNNDNNAKQLPQYYSTVRSNNTPYPELYADAQRVLQETFGLAKLRNLQPAAIRCALQQKSQIVVMATGGGKSLCYQLPATVLGGVTLVISPLIALMQDQVQALNKKGIPAALVSSSQTETQNRAVLERLLGRPLLNNTTTTTATASKTKKSPPITPLSTSTSLPPLTLLYITPESIQTQRFRLILGELYQQRRIAMFAIDEAHCISR
jgi:hypothetical protein